MLTLTKRQHSVGFSAMNADELFFINGGSGSGYNCYMGGGSYSSAPTSVTIPSPTSMPKQEPSFTDKVNASLPAGIKVDNNGLSAPFGKGRISVGGNKKGVTVSWSMNF